MPRDSVVSDGSMSIEDASKFTGLSRAELYKRMDAAHCEREGLVQLAYVKCGRRRLIPRRALVEMLQAGLVDE